MPALRAIAVTARTATILVDAETSRYHLPAPRDWVLNGGAQAGQSAIVPLFLEGLAPDADHRIAVGGDVLEFRTLPCAGLVDATDYGVSLASADNAAAMSKIASAPMARAS